MSKPTANRFICRVCGEPLRKCVDSRQAGNVRLRNYHCACGHSQGTIEIERDYINDSSASALDKFHRKMMMDVDSQALIDELGRRLLEQAK